LSACFNFDSRAGVIAVLANSTVMLVVLEMIRVQSVSKKIMTVAYTTISSQVRGLDLFGLAR